MYDRVPPEARPPVLHGERTKDIAHSFWKSWFAENCQIPRNGLRLFPVNKSYREIYDFEFHEWFGKVYPNSALADAEHDEEDRLTPARQI